jgi:hypothetical protein
MEVEPMREKGSLLAALLVALGLTGMVLAQRAKEDSGLAPRFDTNG